jgi:hypothetical protein
MDTTQLSTIIGLLAALSVASERLVEIAKGLIPWLDQQNSDPGTESRRRAALQFLAAAAGVTTAFVFGQAEGVADLVLVRRMSTRIFPRA